MATFVLTLVLAAGVFGRAIASWIVIGVEKVNPMVHFVADTNEEAYIVLTRLFSIDLSGADTPAPRKIQVELQGHVFVDKRRLLRRSPWPMRMLGIMASPFDLASTAQVGRKEAFELEPLSSSDKTPLVNERELVRRGISESYLPM